MTTQKAPPNTRRASGSAGTSDRKPASRHPPAGPSGSGAAPPVHPQHPPAADSLPHTEDEALDIVGNGEPVAVPTIASVLGGVRSALSHSKGVARETRRLGMEATRIVRGVSVIEQKRGDRRFSDPAWSVNPLFRRLRQGYLALTESLDRLVDDLEARPNIDWHEVERARFAINILSSAIAPTNALPTNPAALKKVFDTAGMSVVRGLGNWWGDIRHNGGMPSQTDRTAFTVGKDLAITPGGVVDRDEMAEILQYAPATRTVHERPLVIVPPPIGRYYFLDLRPGRSFIEHAVSQGLQVFLISWRNPGPEQAEWGLDDYARRILSAIDVASEVSGSSDVNILGFCAGGILSTTVLNHLAESGDDRVHAASFGVTLLDFDSQAPLGAFSAPKVLELAERSSKKNGIVTGQSLSKVFSWMRPDDLVFNYWVNNYLLGEDPPVFDILAWNADSTNLPRRLHEQFLDIFRNNSLCKAGELTVLGTPVDLSRVTVPAYVTGAVTDHLTPWKGCYRTTQLLGGPTAFVLSNAGHIASLVNPPGNPKASYFDGGPEGPAEAWLSGAEKRPGTWWSSWATWVTGHSGEHRAAPGHLGSPAHPVTDPAPGQYVREGATKPKRRTR